MASCWIALNKADRENGCLQVIRGSHKAGRIEHGVYSTQHCADPERVEQLLDRLELIYCELEPGSAVFSIATRLTDPMLTSASETAGI